MTTRTVKPPLPRKLSIPLRKMITINAWLLVHNLQKMLPDLVDPFWISAMLAFSTYKRSAAEENLTTP